LKKKGVVVVDKGAKSHGFTTNKNGLRKCNGRNWFLILGWMEGLGGKRGITGVARIVVILSIQRK